MVGKLTGKEYDEKAIKSMRIHFSSFCHHWPAYSTDQEIVDEFEYRYRHVLLAEYDETKPKGGLNPQLSI